MSSRPSATKDRSCREVHVKSVDSLSPPVGMPKTDENHLVQDQVCTVDDVDAPNQDLLYGFALQSPSVVSHCHPTTECQL
ncbi:hypothetical protein TNCV_1429911 [Trichonephila clavipes]|nr:hypothetical protein TNCV_1429911 [Trichonephila clavipes]